MKTKEAWQACRNKIATCLEKEAPACASACPFHLDVREFITRLARGGFNTAFRLYSNTVAFPGIVAHYCPAPCRGVCVMEGHGGPIELRLLEQAALDYARNTQPNRYSMPENPRKIAIVGGGMSGLACALRLANRKYQVTLFEKSGRIGGRLWQEADPDIFLPDIEAQFQFTHYDLRLNEEITDLDQLADYDAVYLATGEGGEDFGLARTVEGPYASSRHGVFLGGSLTGVDAIHALAQGLLAAREIENFLKTDNMKDLEPYPPSRIKLHPSVIIEKDVVRPADQERYSKEEAIAEAGRCLRCQCDACLRYCEMMSYFRKFPQRIEEEVYVSVYPCTLDGVGTVATRLISTCNQCGLCGKICPEGIDVGQFLRHSHRLMLENGLMPWAFHDFWLRDLAFTNGGRAALTLTAPGGGASEYLFFPGCQLGASDPRYVSETYAFLLRHKPDTALMLHCCGAPAVWAAELEKQDEVLAAIRAAWQQAGQPRFVLACPTCQTMFREFLPEIETVFLYDLLSRLGLEPQMQGQGAEYSVFDPCASRDDPLTQQQVRAFAEQAGFALQPLPYEGEFARCCSWGGQISTTNPRYQQWLVEERVKAGENPYLAYCVNCRDIFAGQGKEVLHILDVLFDLNDAKRSAPDISERRHNRQILKRRMLQAYRPEQLLPEEVSPVKILTDEQVRRKMHKEYMLDEDVRSVIDSCEAEGRKVMDAETGRFIGHRLIGKMTYWVEYSPEADGWRVHNVYAHRMSVDEKR